MKKQTTTMKKVTTLKGTKVVGGYFVDKPYCPCCKQYVDSLMVHLKECKEADKAAKKYGSGGY